MRSIGEGRGRLTVAWVHFNVEPEEPDHGIDYREVLLSHQALDGGAKGRGVRAMARVRVVYVSYSFRIRLRDEPYTLTGRKPIPLE